MDLIGKWNPEGVDSAQNRKVGQVDLIGKWNLLQRKVNSDRQVNSGRQVGPEAIVRVERVERVNSYPNIYVEYIYIYMYLCIYTSVDPIIP